MPSARRLWDAKVKDIHEWLVADRLPQTAAGCGMSEVTYHESCHLCHGQKITSQPRTVLNSIPGLRVIELTESNWCCGSAGIYNITQPEQSAKLLRAQAGQHRRGRERPPWRPRIPAAICSSRSV